MNFKIFLECKRLNCPYYLYFKIVRILILNHFTLLRKKKRNLLFNYSLPRINLTKKIMRKIAPIVTHITGIA